MKPKLPFVAARKMGMTTLFDSEGRRRGVTLLKVLPARVVCVRTEERDGHHGVQLGYGEVPMASLNRPDRGHQQAGLGALEEVGCQVLAEVRLEGASPLAPGDALGLPLASGDRVVVRGVSKGRGFTGVMRRHNFTGGGKAHGSSGVTRRPLSAGAMGPARIWPGQKMPGRHGNNSKEVRNSAIVEVDEERGIIALEGGVPGARGALVHIYPTAERFATWLEGREVPAEEPVEEPVAEAAPEAPAEAADDAPAEAADAEEEKG